MRRLEGAVFLSGAVLMGLEIAGSRVLAPVFGTSVFVWGALITTFLTALAAGYALGGRVADLWPRAEVLAGVIAVAGILVWVLSWRPAPILAAVASIPGIADRFQALLAALFLFAPPSVLMGVVTPFAVRLRARDLASVGSSAGRLSAISTAGSILGAFLMAFVLIPAWPLGPILFGLGASLVLAALFALPVVGPAVLAISFGALAAAGAVFFLSPSPVESPTPGGTVVLQKETAYHRLRVVDQGRRRALYFDNRLQGWVQKDAADRRAKNYIDGMLASLAFRSSAPRRTVSVGLGVGMLPSFVAEQVPGASSVSVEIDPEVGRIARDWFGFRESPRNAVIVGDGRRELGRMEPGLDAIFVDAYFADSVPFHLVTREFFVLAREKLSADGVLAVNFVGVLTGERNALFWSAYRTVQEVFPRLYVLSPELSERGRRTFASNVILIASRSPDRLSRDEVASRAVAFGAQTGRPEIGEWGRLLYDGDVRTEGLPVLTDAYSPTDALQYLVRR